MGLITEEEDEHATGTRGLGRRARTQNEEAEITLGMRSLLGIFFGLVLICGIFFGLGYSVGRSGGARVATEENPASNPAVANANLKKPSAEQGLTPVPEPTPTAMETTAANSPAENEQASTPAPATTESKPAAATTPTPAPTAKPAVAASQPAQIPARPQTASTQPAAVPARPQVGMNQPAQVQPVAAAVPSSSFMVQIAAVRLPTDANVLVTALNRRGYRAVVWNESTDALLHVQVGPFASRLDANNMRAKLLADGYNAVVK